MRLGLDEVPVIKIQRLRGKLFAAYNIADNQTASISQWDYDSLANALKELKTEQVSLPAMGFSEAQLEALLTPEEQFDWEGFDESMRTKPTLEYGLLPVKVRRAKRELFKTAIRKHTEEQGITEQDAAMVAGKVLRHLLGLDG